MHKICKLTEALLGIFLFFTYRGGSWARLLRQNHPVTIVGAVYEAAVSWHIGIWTRVWWPVRKCKRYRWLERTL